MFRHVFAATALSLAILAAHGQTPVSPLPPIADYFKLPAVDSPNLSPNGKYLAVTAPVNGRMNLAIVELDTRKATAITNFNVFDVQGIRWIGNDKLVFSLGQNNSPTGPGQFDGGGFYVVSRDGTTSRQLAKTVKETRASGQRVYRGVDYLSRIPGSEDEILVTGNLRSADAEDIYRMDLRTGRTTLLTPDRPERTQDWVLDANRVPRVVTSWVKDTQNFIVHYRKDDQSPWLEIMRTDRVKGPSFAVLGIMADNKTLMVAANPGRDTMAVYRFDPESKKLGEQLAQHPRFDMGADALGERVPGVITEPVTDRVKGYAVRAERPQIVWVDEKEAKTQATIDSALPDTYNYFLRLPNSSRVLITSFSDVKSETWYLLDEEKRTLEELFVARPWMGKDHLVQQRPFVLKTRDGLEIPSYYFLPKNYKPGDRLPTVIHIHGGPQVRADRWGQGTGVREAQLLASRGYAVVLPNFRITPGLGSKIVYAGFGTVGRQMSEDHEDAVAWAIKEGFTDPKRVCMSGASYGGFATLRALAKTPDMFKCGVAGLVVSDWELQLTSPSGDTFNNPAGVAFWHELMGLSANSNALKENSPVYMADKIKAPLFMYAGADDIRTPLEQTTRMISALEKAGNPPRVVMIKQNEGHGYGKVENRVELYEKMLEFLDQQIGSKSR